MTGSIIEKWSSLLNMWVSVKIPFIDGLPISRCLPPKLAGSGSLNLVKLKIGPEKTRATVDYGRKIMNTKEVLDKIFKDPKTLYELTEFDTLGNLFTR